MSHTSGQKWIPICLIILLSECICPIVMSNTYIAAVMIHKDVWLKCNSKKYGTPTHTRALTTTPSPNSPLKLRSTPRLSVNLYFAPFFHGFKLDSQSAFVSHLFQTISNKSYHLMYL